ncbi:MAG TPA: copper-binding protein [Terriglobales bacterium]|nr:copper-binding protein [Terriglobales bacterium]
MKRIFAMNRLMTVFAAALLTAAICLAQAVPTKKALTFQGKVETVNEAAKSLKVNGEKVEGWMDAMIMDYKVDDPAILKKLKAGDQIMATVYEGDMVLHKVMVMPKTDNMKSKK